MHTLDDLLHTAHTPPVLNQPLPTHFQAHLLSTPTPFRQQDLNLPDSPQGWQMQPLHSGATAAKRPAIFTDTTARHEPRPRIGNIHGASPSDHGMHNSPSPREGAPADNNTIDTKQAIAVADAHGLDPTNTTQMVQLQRALVTLGGTPAGVLSHLVINARVLELGEKINKLEQMLSTHISSTVTTDSAASERVAVAGHAAALANCTVFRGRVLEQCQTELAQYNHVDYDHLALIVKTHILTNPTLYELTPDLVKLKSYQDNIGRVCTKQAGNAKGVFKGMVQSSVSEGSKTSNRAYVHGMLHRFRQPITHPILMNHLCKGAMLRELTRIWNAGQSPQSTSTLDDTTTTIEMPLLDPEDATYKLVADSKITCWTYFQYLHAAFARWRVHFQSNTRDYQRFAEDLHFLDEAQNRPATGDHEAATSTDAGSAEIDQSPTTVASQSHVATNRDFTYGITNWNA